MMVKVNCSVCGKEFERESKEVKRSERKGYKHNCSKECALMSISVSNTKDKIPNVECAQCGKCFYKPKSRIENSNGYHFCNRKCKDKAQKIGGIRGIMPSHYGEFPGVFTYRVYALAHYGSKCQRCGYDKYVQVLEVHHKDRNRLNNAIENLEVLCCNCHSEDHYLHGDGKFYYLSN